ncbi:hypothetical protein L8C07_04675 [Paenibacillus sp. CMAA1739]|uniref:DUF3592 domain-containing protein n=1 Tax=Paenibacillus ottowii TaxID=2315729 RepID=UPI00273164EE|nr:MULTISPECIES: DUF3592 domain-containing protein [Paenibacillus]MDP1508648.1 hypothetical protein [Paenibacillus ottowii]MEC4565229.1 hypothetical protein [Paenibacillus sp. CMAA1739]
MKGFLSLIGLLLVFGVGFSPFLAEYLWDDPFLIMEAPWYRPLIYTGFALIFLPSILGLFFGGGKIKKGVSGVGIITSVQQTGTYINNQPQVKLGLTVTKQGEDKYDTALTTIIPLTSMAQFQPGTIIPLIISERNKMKVGLDLKGQVSQMDLQALMNEQMVKQGVSPELMEIAKTGEQAYAKILDVRPMGEARPNKIKLQFTLTVTKSNGETFDVTTQKDVFSSQLSKLQQGSIVEVIYSPQDPSKLVIKTQVSEDDVQQAFGSSQ